MRLAKRVLALARRLPREERFAHGSLAELHTQLMLSVRARWLAVDDVGEAYGLIDEIGRMLTALKRRWRTMPPRGAPDPLPRRS